MSKHKTPKKQVTDFEAAQDIAIILRNRDNGEQERILRWVSESLELPSSPVGSPRSHPEAILSEPSPAVGIARKLVANDRKPSFTDRETISPKDFLHEKQPRTDVERVACLAYYLCNYRDIPHFKTTDISKLNMEAAQLRFSNSTYAVSNATKSGLLATAGKGKKQMSAIGERFVAALPDHEDAKAVLGRMRQRRSRKKSSNTKRSRKTNK